MPYRWGLKHGVAKPRGRNDVRQPPETVVPVVPDGLVTSVATRVYPAAMLGKWCAKLGVLLTCVACFGACDSDDDTIRKPGVLTDGGAFDVAAPDTPTDVSPMDVAAGSDSSNASEPDSAPDAAMACTAQLDPAPTRQTPGIYNGDGSPTSTDEVTELTLAGQTAYVFTGNVNGAVGNGTFYVIKLGESANGCASEIAGIIPTTPGSYSVNIPLYCGPQLVKFVWSNASGQLVRVQKVITTQCSEPDLRVTIAWDDQGRDWELHLIKNGGRINNNATDCTWTSCLGAGPDWGVVGDATDNPSKDVDDTGPYGPENIVLSKPEAIRYHVLLEHWGAGQPSKGQAIINVRGRVTLIPIDNFITRHVRTLATIDFPSEAVNVINSDYDCSGTWSSGCLAALPPQ